MRVWKVRLFSRERERIKSFNFQLLGVSQPLGTDSRPCVPGAQGEGHTRGRYEYGANQAGLGEVWAFMGHGSRVPGSGPADNRRTHCSWPIVSDLRR